MKAHMFRREALQAVAVSVEYFANERFYSGDRFAITRAEMQALVSAYSGYSITTDDVMQVARDLAILVTA